MKKTKKAIEEATKNSQDFIVPDEEIPADLGLKMISRQEAAWRTVKERSKQNIEHYENELMVAKELMLLAERKIKEEERRRK